MQLFRLFLALAGWSLAALSFAAAEPAQEAPDEMVKRVTAEVMSIVRHDREIKSGNQERIQEVVESKILPYLDMRRATALAVGRHWRAATPQQQQQLIDAFRSLLMHTYAGALSQVGDQKLDYEPLRAAPDATDVVVRFRVQPKRGAEPVQVGYHLYKSPDGWKVYDVNVLGVWMIQTYKDSFTAEIGRGGIDGLIRTLEEKNRTLAAR
ncbi:phospholipid-binding protein MlaC [Noviherbaspirillum sp. UKPF54]|uniref:MlaC/ttg2D family ABC transporter substrate-binding protein n=1 Tax=Noviherbaspirillum sp. UKPF54 TaxID=2601898 RepID=UPI0011B19191|nr:ABC transporter substrate-binding protein [Noviherbaspirillum sp. UKPF54]QDZ30036.1 ABC transporter substrate-binding protein [Noviherbaspirillum sp. UKPF54]